MKKRKVYIVARSSRASEYGIGTYRANLIECLKGAGTEFGIIELGALVDEVSAVRRDGYEIVSIPFVHSDNVKHAEYYSRNIAYFLREMISDDPEYDLIFHLNSMTDPTLVINLKKLFRCKIVLTVHYTNWSFELLGDMKECKNILTRKKSRLDEREKMIRKSVEDDLKMIRKCDMVVYIADHSAETMSKQTKTKNKVVINNGLRDDYRKLSLQKRDSIRAKYFIAPATKVIVFAGRLDEVKGVRYLIQSFREVLLEHPDSLLVIAGDGDFFSLLKEAEDIWSKMVLTGRLDKKKLYELYRIADIGVSSSIHEEFGYVAVEMMMHGLPVIVSDTGGLAEIVEDGISGLKVPVVTRKGQRGLDTKLLAARIDLLLNDQDLAVRLSEGARKRFLERYELSVFGEKMITLYNNL